MKKKDNQKEPFVQNDEWRYILEQELMKFTQDEKELIIDYVSTLIMKRTQQS